MDLNKGCSELKTQDKEYFIHIIQLLNQIKYRMCLFKDENVINIL